jgi:hypothetical protein
LPALAHAPTNENRTVALRPDKSLAIPGAESVIEKSIMRYLIIAILAFMLLNASEPYWAAWHYGLLLLPFYCWRYGVGLRLDALAKFVVSIRLAPAKADPI